MKERQSALSVADTLLNPECYPHAVSKVSIIETHISWVILTGKFAYKVKKPVDLGFCDFTTLEKRKKFCKEELRLNVRLAPEIYIDVVPITGNKETPKVEGGGAPIEYAVKMREFSQNSLAGRVVKTGGITGGMVDRLAKKISDFHQFIPCADSSMPYGEPERLFDPMKNNFTKILSLIDDSDERNRIFDLQSFSEGEYGRQRIFLESRKAARFIRECHGDMHLGNMAIIDSDLLIFDAVEFNDYLRWIDVMSDMAFLVMDFTDRERPDLGWRVLDRYLSHTGDYDGLKVLRHFMIYRALVRAKIAKIRENQDGISSREKREAFHLFHEYVALAESFTKKPPSPTIYITRGVSGSGKSTIAGLVTEKIGAIRVRSDIERKRLFGLSNDEPGKPARDIYNSEATLKVYNRLSELAGKIILAGYNVVVDATFLKKAQRNLFLDLAISLDVKCVILDVTADSGAARNRIRKRIELGDDASEADIEVMERQIEAMEPFTENESAMAVGIDLDDLESIEKMYGMITE